MQNMSTDVVSLIANAGPVAKFVLLVLFGFSIVSWALIVEKWWRFRTVRRQSTAFLRVFRQTRRPSAALGAAKSFTVTHDSVWNPVIEGRADLNGDVEIKFEGGIEPHEGSVLALYGPKVEPGSTRMKRPGLISTSEPSIVIVPEPLTVK